MPSLGVNDDATHLELFSYFTTTFRHILEFPDYTDDVTPTCTYIASIYCNIKFRCSAKLKNPCKR